MSPLDVRALDLRNLVQDIVGQFQEADAAAATEPHVELSVQELRVVEYLGDHGPRMMRELAEFLRLAVNSVTTLIDNLEKKQIVRRQRSDADRRIIRVELIDAGKAAYSAALGEKLRLLRRMLGALTEDEQEIFMLLFRKIARAERSQAQKKASFA